MFKCFLTTVFAATAALFPIASASAAETPDPLAKWVAQVNKQIDQRGQDPIDDQYGVARITFRRGPDGRAIDVVGQNPRSSVARAGVRTVKLLRHLPPLPNGLPADEKIAMNFLVGRPDAYLPFVAQREQLLASAAANNVKVASLMSRTQVASLDGR